MACLSLVQEEEALLLSSWPVDRSSELRLGEAQQRADRLGFDVEHPRDRVGFDPLVPEPRGDRKARGKGLKRLGSIHVSTVRIGLRARIGSALPISCSDDRTASRRKEGQVAYFHPQGGGLAVHSVGRSLTVVTVVCLLILYA